MIAVNVNAGLANQMFHYAFGRGLMAKGVDVVFDLSNFHPRKEWSFEAITLSDAFPNIDIPAMPEGHFKWVMNNTLKGKIMRRVSNMIGPEKYIMEESYGYIPDMEKRAKGNCIYRGFWHSELYFKHCKEDIKKQFFFVPFDEEKNVVISEKMKGENSVAIHLRKGKDYLQSDLMGKGLCTAEYYMSAIEYIKSKVEKPTFYVFTDNPEWVKENLPPFEYTLVDWNNVSGNRSFRDMQLMTCVKHNIIGNSTYSWWGAWLNPNPSKIVIAPKKWFNPVSKFMARCDVVCDNWVKL